MATGLDTARLKTQLENERQRLELADSDVERTKLIPINVLGVNFDVNLRLTHEIKTPDDPLPTLDYAVDVALTKRPEVKAQERRVQVAKLPLIGSRRGLDLPEWPGALDPCKPSPS